jgi:hypothetical protein
MMGFGDATHKTALVRAWLARRPHYHAHFTPASASWINQVERWFAEPTRKQLRRGVHTLTSQLKQDIRSFINRYNENPSSTAGPNPPTKSSPRPSATARLPSAPYAANFRVT